MSPSPQTAEAIIEAILRREGGSTFTDHPADRGGATRWGITIATLQRHRPSATVKDVMELTEAEARRIYELDYIHIPGFDRIIDPDLRALLVDFGVTSSPARATSALQLAVGTAPDGVIGPDTLVKLSAIAPAIVYARVLRRYLGHFVNVVLSNPSQIVFLRGWVNRAGEFIR